MRTYFKATVCTVVAASMIAAGCSKKSTKIEPAYVSPARFQHLECDQIRAELVQVSARVREASGHQDDEANKDAVALGVGLVLFWPALFFMIGDDRKAEIANLKGEYDALKQVATQKNCDVATEIAEAERLEAERIARRKHKTDFGDEDTAEGTRVSRASPEDEACPGNVWGPVQSEPHRPFRELGCD